MGRYTPYHVDRAGQISGKAKGAAAAVGDGVELGSLGCGIDGVLLTTTLELSVKTGSEYQVEWIGMEGMGMLC